MTLRQVVKEVARSAFSAAPAGHWSRISDLCLPFGETTLRLVVRDLEREGALESITLPPTMGRPARAYRLIRP